jgi:ABC-type antimicrobial peptide transport system permease subunit
MYFHYTSRSLLRGGQRTVLACFCVGVGVMALVALQLVGLMINSAMTANVRDANGGDINVTSGPGSRAFTRSDLGYFDQLKHNRIIAGYTALSSLNGSFGTTMSVDKSFSVQIVDPATFPVVSAPVFTQPAYGSLAALLIGNGAIIDQKLADAYQKRIGNTLVLHIASGQQPAQLLAVKVAGIVTDSGALAQASRVVLVSRSCYRQTLPQTPLTFTTIDVTTIGDTQATSAARRISDQYPLATVQTSAQALQSTQSLSDTVKKFLEIAGLLALLIGGVGIVNTMQVLLSRRKVEIAMLKTTGYRRIDLYLLFGLEAGLLGLSGGVLGSVAALGISYIVRNVVERTFSLNIPFLLNWPVIGGGVLIGLCTALIFGLLPIVQSANIRPLSVLRDFPGSNRAGSVALTIGLLLTLSVLFCTMSVVILNDVGLGIEVVYGAFAFLIILSGFFLLASFLISLLPVPDRFNGKFIALILASIVLATLIVPLLPTIGFLLLLLSVLGFYLVHMPRTWKANVRMALRNIGRQRARTTTTLLALFVGIFTIGLIIVLGQNVRDLVNNSLANILSYNVITSASGPDATTLRANIKRIPGLKSYEQSYRAEMVPVKINAQAIEQILQGVPEYSGEDNLGRYGVLSSLSSLSGFDVAHDPAPASQLNATIVAGRDLNASDASTPNVVIPWILASAEPLKSERLGVGSTITVTSFDGKNTITLTVVGLYRARGAPMGGQGLYSTKSTVALLSPGGVLQSNFSLKIDPTQVKQALAKIGQLAPESQSFNLANIGDYISQYLNDIMLVLIIIASLSLLAGVIIIANAVALAMLERRRELGILKSVGYTSVTVLGEVLIENAIIGGLGAFLAMLLVTCITTLLGQLAFKTAFSVNGIVTLALIIGSALLAVITALLVAWGSVRVRPLAVLRYE